MKANKKWITHQELKARLLKNPAVRKEYERLGPEFQIARQMIEARIKQNISQEQLAKRAKTGQAVISRLEGLNAKPSISLLSKIATALDVEITITIKPV